MPEDQIPYGLWFRRYAPFTRFGSIGIGEFEGDTRTQASGTISDPSRTYGCVLFNQSEAVKASAGSSGSTLFGVLGGSVSATAKVKMTFTKKESTGAVEFSAYTEGGNPLVPGAPDIDTYVNVKAAFSTGQLNISGDVLGDNFPNLEVFVYCYRSKKSAIIVDGRTTGGRDSGPAARLFGTHSTHRIAKFDVSLPLDSIGRLTAARTAAATTLTEYPAAKPLPRENGLKL